MIFALKREPSERPEGDLVLLLQVVSRRGLPEEENPRK
jgi:hypothetical protein